MRALRPDDLIDVRVQDRLRRDLEIKLGQMVIDAIGTGLQPDNALKAVQGVVAGEMRLHETRRAFERTYQ